MIRHRQRQISVLGGRAGRFLETEVTLREARDILLQPLRHGFFFAQNLRANPRCFLIAHVLGGADKNTVRRDLHRLEGIARERALHHLVADEEAAERLRETEHLCARILDDRRASAPAFDAAANELGLPLRLLDVLFDAAFEVRIIFEAASHAAEHGFSLLLGRMRIAQPFHQPFFGAGHSPLLFARFTSSPADSGTDSQRWSPVFLRRKCLYVNERPRRATRSYVSHLTKKMRGFALFANTIGARAHGAVPRAFAHPTGGSVARRLAMQRNACAWRVPAPLRTLQVEA